MLVLALLAEAESYGYELVTRLEAAGLQGIAPGTVYPVLTRLERESLLTSHLVPSDAGPARKYYRPNAAGMSTLDAAESSWRSLAVTVNRILPTSKESS